MRILFFIISVLALSGFRANTVFTQKQFLFDTQLTSGRPSLAYSLRRLSKLYTHAVQIRRSSDNAVQDIGFTVGGDFDVTSFNTFVGGGTGYVVKWYDQSGYQRHAVQLTQALQPTLTIFSGNPQINFAGSSYFDTGTLATTVTNNGADGSMIFIANSTSAAQDLAGVRNGIRRWSAHLNWGDGNLYFDPGGAECCQARVSVANGANDGSWIQYSLIRGGTTSLIRWSGVQRAANTGVSADYAGTDNFHLGQSNGGNTKFAGSLKEFVTFAAGVAGADLSKIENSQKTYFGTP